MGEPPSPDAQPVPAQSATKWLPLSPVATLPLPGGRLALPHQPSPLMASPVFSPAVQAVSRKLYRLLRRTFAQWQPSSSASLEPIVKLWLVVLAPWKASTFNDTKELLAMVDALNAAAQRGARSAGRTGGTLGGTAGALGSTAGAVLRGAAGSAAGLVGSSGRASSSGEGGQHHSLFGGAGQVAASAAANLNRWGSEMAHHLSGAGPGGELDQMGDRRGTDARVSVWLLKLMHGGYGSVCGYHGSIWLREGSTCRLEKPAQ